MCNTKRFHENESYDKKIGRINRLMRFREKRKMALVTGIK